MNRGGTSSSCAHLAAVYVSKGESRGQLGRFPVSQEITESWEVVAAVKVVRKGKILDIF